MLAIDSILLVGSSAPIADLVTTEAGRPWPRQLSVVVDSGDAASFVIGAQEIHAAAPGVVHLRASDATTHRSTPIRVGAIYDLRRPWHVRIECPAQLPYGETAWVITTFVSDKATFSVGENNVVETPSWRPPNATASFATATGGRTDTLLRTIVSGGVPRADTTVSVSRGTLVLSTYGAKSITAQVGYEPFSVTLAQVTIPVSPSLDGAVNGALACFPNGDAPATARPMHAYIHALQ